jgi:nitric oxide reductase subunit B
VLMLVLFAVQVVYGMILVTQHVDPTVFEGVMNFNVVHAEHLNLGIMWIVCGFIGAVLFVAPLLSRRETVSPWLIKLLFYAVIAFVVWNFFTQFLAERGMAGWWLGQPWFQQGLEYLEAGRIAGIVILVGFAIFAYVVLRTFPLVRKWNEIHWSFGLGVTALRARPKMLLGDFSGL